ncbi:MAG: carboxypeptidase-like regulatory domain-containing protein [Patescibacteria group bacterium]
MMRTAYTSRVRFLAALVLMTLVVIVLYQALTARAFSSGAGTWDDPYVVTTCAELESIGSTAANRHANYVLGNDIDCSSIPSYTPIGTANSPFTGRFDGAGYTISHLTAGSAFASYVGVFGHVYGGVVRNVHVDDADILGEDHLGAVVGQLNAGMILGVRVTNSAIVVNDGPRAGGIVGNATESYLNTVSATGTSITLTNDTGSNSGIGGIAGDADFTNITNAYSDATIAATGATLVGGIVGGSARNVEISDSYFVGTVTGTSLVGGILGGASTASAPITVRSSYFSGAATGTAVTAIVGGLVGSISASASLIQDSFSTGAVSTSTNAGGIVGSSNTAAANFSNLVYSRVGTTRSRCEGNSLPLGDATYTSGQCTFQDTDSYYNSSSNAPLSSWNFTDIWETVPSNRPILRAFPFVEATSYTSVGSCAALSAALLDNANGWYSLTGDIDCAGDTALAPFASTSSKAFTGRLDGNGHTIDGVSYTTSASGNHYGLFIAAFGAIFEDFTLAGTGIVAENKTEVGGLAGIGSGSVLLGVHSTVPVETGSGGDYVIGGLVGQGGGLIIEDSSVNADVTTDGFGYAIGGLVGFANYLHVTDSQYLGGTVRGGDTVGGIVGFASAVYMDSVASAGTITGSSYMGGLGGDVLGPSTISNSSSTASIVGNTDYDTFFGNIGGLVGSAFDIAFLNVVSQNLIDISVGDGAESVGGIAGVIDSSGYTMTNATSTATFVIAGDAGSFWGSIGGLVGGSSGHTYSNLYASTTIEVATALAPAATIESIGLILGLSDGDTMASSSALGAIVLHGNTASGVLSDIGGLVGSMNGFDHAENFVTADIDITGFNVSNIGGYAGSAYGIGSTLTTSYATTTVTILSSTPSSIGGFFGDFTSAGITETFALGSLDITAGQGGTGHGTRTGGFVGSASGGTFENVYTAVDISLTENTASGNGSSFGGFVGYLAGLVTLDNVYASGDLIFTASGGSTVNRIGGLLGESAAATNAISNSFSAGAVTPIIGSLQVGGFLGLHNGSETLDNNHYDVTRSGQAFCTQTDEAWCTGDNVGSADSDYFYDDANEPMASWDFSAVWDSHDDTHPTFEYFASLFGPGAEDGGGATAPTMTASAASAVTDTTATLNGNITAVGSATPTARGFEYGLTTAYGATTTEAGSFSTGAYTASASSLTCNTAYHFRSYATSADGTGYSADDTFTTSACTGGGGGGGNGSGRREIEPPVISNVRSTITDGSVRITWDTDTPASTQIVYGPTQCLGLSTPESNTGTSRTTKHVVVLPTFACRNSAHFSALSVDAHGNRSVSPGHSNNLLLCPAFSPPPSPSLLSCPYPQPAVPVPTPVPVAPAPAISSPVVEIPIPPASEIEPTVIVNGGNPITNDPIVGVQVTPPAGTVAFVLFDAEDPSHTVSVPVAVGTVVVDQEWELCTNASACTGGEHTLAVFFIDASGAESTVIRRTVTLVSGREEPTAISAGTEGDSIFTRIAAGIERILTDGSRAVAPVLALLPAAGIATSALGIIWALASRLRSLSDIPMLAYRAFATIFGFGYLRRRDRAWGTVYDSRTRRPLDPAVVTLHDASGKDMKTVITDLDGRFAFLADAGTYSITAAKGHHSFPAQNLPAIDPLYPYPYTGGPIPVGEEGVIVKDIPLDPVDFDWNEYEKYRRGLYRFFSRFDRPLAYAALILTPLGALISLVAAVLEPSVINIVFLFLYALIGLLYYVAGFAPRVYGMLLDATGQPLAFAVVKAFRPGATSTGIHVVADHLGRYYLLLPRESEFDIQVEMRAGEEAYTPVFRERLTGLKGHLNRHIRVPLDLP